MLPSTMARWARTRPEERTGSWDLAGALAAPCLWSVGVQFEFSAWVSTTKGCPLPTTKGQIDLMASFPEVSATCHALVLF